LRNPNGIRGWIIRDTSERVTAEGSRNESQMQRVQEFVNYEGNNNELLSGNGLY